MNNPLQHLNYACRPSTIMPWDKFSKVDAIQAIFAAFYESAKYQATPTDDVDAAIRMYLAIFDQHNSSRQVSAEWGARYVRGSESDHEDEDPAWKDGPERLRTQSPIPQGSSAKKHALDESLFPWLMYELTDNTFLTPSQELTRKMVQRTKITPSTLNSQNLKSSVPSKFQNFLTWNGTTSSLENLSISMSFLLACTPPRLTPEPLRTLENLNFILEQLNQQNLLKPMATGLLLGELLSERLNSSSHTAKGNLKNTLNTFHPTSHPYIPVHIGRSSNSTRPSESMQDQSTMSPSMNSTNSDISRPTTFMGMCQWLSWRKGWGATLVFGLRLRSKANDIGRRVD